MKTLIIVGIFICLLINIYWIKELISPTCCKYGAYSFDNCCRDNIRPEAVGIIIFEMIVGFIWFSIKYLP